MAHFFTLEQFIKVVDANITTKDELKTITEDMEKQSMEGVDEDFVRRTTLSCVDI